MACALAERLRAARGVPQAIVKVASYAQGLREAMGQVSYISRKGKLEIETDEGERLATMAQQKALVHEWARDFGRRKNSRDTVHLVFSMPHGSDPEALRRSVRKVSKREFPDQEAVFVVHTDKKHPHAHVVMKMRAREKKKKLRTPEKKTFITCAKSLPKRRGRKGWSWRFRPARRGGSGAKG